MSQVLENRMTETDLKAMAATLVGSFPKLNKNDQTLAITLYRLLAQGKPVTLLGLAEKLGVALEAVTQVLKTWPGVYFDDENNVIGFWGLALPEMNHHFEIEGRPLYAWCAWDTLFLPQLLGKTAKVESTCPVTGEKIRLTVTPNKILDLSPPETVLSFITPEAALIQEDIVQHFCHYIHFFNTIDSGRQWISENKSTFLLSINDAFLLGQFKNSLQFGSAI